MQPQTDVVPPDCGTVEIDSCSEITGVFMQDESYPRIYRLRKSADYDRVMTRKCSQRGKYLLVHGCENDMGFARLGRIIGKRWGHAVRRNLYRRWIREAFRQTRSTLPALDLVVMIHRDSGITYADIKNELGVLAVKVAEVLARFQ